MTRKQLGEFLMSIDPVNVEYIMADRDVENECESLLRWERKDPLCLSVLNKSDDVEERCNSISGMIRERLAKMIREYDSMHLTPANVKVGDGATVNLWSDSHAGTIVKVTKTTITIRQDTAICDPKFKPEFVIGGFSAHCTNQYEQTYTYEPDENGRLTTIRWSKKHNRYGTPGNVYASKGRHEFYDYNF